MLGPVVLGWAVLVFIVLLMVLVLVSASVVAVIGEEEYSVVVWSAA